MKTLFQLLNIVVDTAKQDSTTNFLRQISNNTEVKFYETGWDNLYSWITIIIAAIALGIAIWTLIAQMHTERHTKNAPYKTQEGILRDMPRHIYRNLVCTFSMIQQFEENRRQHQKDPSTILRYPSESNVLKLQTLPEEVILKIDLGGNSNGYIEKQMHETSLLFRNYNLEVQVAADHFSRKGIDNEALRTDYDNLLFKPFFLLYACKKLSTLLYENLPECKEESLTTQLIMSIMLAEHINKGAALDNDHPEIPADLTEEKFPFDSFKMPDIKNAKGRNPIERSFATLFKDEKTGLIIKDIQKDVLFRMLTVFASTNEEKKKVGTFISYIQNNENTIYGDVLNKNTTTVDFWNLFKIMSYLDAAKEKDNIGMVNVA